MQIVELNPFKSLVVANYVVCECRKVVVVAFQELNHLYLPHLFNFNIIKIIALRLFIRMWEPSRALRLEKALEYDYVELTIFRAG